MRLSFPGHSDHWLKPESSVSIISRKVLHVGQKILAGVGQAWAWGVGGGPGGPGRQEASRPGELEQRAVPRHACAQAGPRFWQPWETSVSLTEVHVARSPGACEAGALCPTPMLERTSKHCLCLDQELLGICCSLEVSRSRKWGTPDGRQRSSNSTDGSQQRDPHSTHQTSRPCAAPQAPPLQPSPCLHLAVASDGLQMAPACAPFPVCPLQSRITFQIAFLIMLPYYSDCTMASRSF